MIKYAVIPIILLSLVSCKSNDSPDTNSSSPQNIADLEASGAIPTLDRSTSILGPDSNNDGIRDDVETFINENYPIEIENKSLRQNASALQESLTVDTSDALAVKEVSIAVTKSIVCTFKSFSSQSQKSPEDALGEIESVTTNTKGRLLAYLAYNKSLDGTASSIPEVNNCD